MDVFEAVDSRIACRAFLDKPVDLNIVKDLIVKAQRAASGGNLQSWNVYALTGAPLAEFKAIVKNRITNEDPRHTKSEYPIYPEPMWGAYKERREEHGVQLYGLAGLVHVRSIGRRRNDHLEFECRLRVVGIDHNSLDHDHVAAERIGQRRGVIHRGGKQRRVAKRRCDQRLAAGCV